MNALGREELLLKKDLASDIVNLIAPMAITAFSYESVKKYVFTVDTVNL